MKKNIILRLTSLIFGLLFLSSFTNSPAVITLPSNSGLSQVKINQIAPPVPCELVCSGDQTIMLSPGQCEKIVFYDVHTTGDCLPSVVVQTSGLPSGSAFPVGVTHNCFSVDLPPLGLPDGDTTCCFDVIVNEFSNPTSVLNCNGLVNISLDENCQHCIGAGSILEGGPYRCYDNYLVDLDITPPLGDGPWVSACVGYSDIGKTYQVRVTDPVSLNNCSGNVIIEDKLPPKLECRDIIMPCNADPNLNAEPAPPISAYQEITYTGLNDPIGEVGAPVPDIQVYSFDFSYLPAGTPVLDVNCRIKLSEHSWLPDLDIVVTAPDGTTAGIFAQSGCFGAIWPIDVLFDDEGAGDLFSCDQLNVGGAPTQCVVLPGVSDSTILSVFDGKNASGIWTVTISDSSDGDDGVIEIVCLQILVDQPQALTIDNCGGAVDLSYIDSETSNDCASGFTKTIQRSWQASDAFGNTASCIQNIQLRRPILADVTLPVNFDNISAPAFACQNNGYPTPDWIKSQGLQGFPWVFGLPTGCDIIWDYQDLVTPVCEGTYDIVRDWTIVDFCTGETVLHSQTIKVVDEVAPVIANCPSSPSSISDMTFNDPTLWHNIFNPSLPSQDLTEMEMDLTITSADNCSGGNLDDVHFLLFLDLDSDGTMESVLNSNKLPGADTIRYNNVNTPGYLGGTPVSFDSRPVPTNQKWHFSRQNITTATEATTVLRWNTELAPNTYVLPQLPQGTHKIMWIVPDDCGNETACEHTFTIEEGPTSGIGDLETEGFALYQNEPNPFSQHTNISFRLPNTVEATLSVYDIEGRLLFGKSDYFGQGFNSIPLEGEWLNAPAVLYYKLESGPHVAWRKMVLLR